MAEYAAIRGGKRQRLRRWALAKPLARPGTPSIEGPLDGDKEVELLILFLVLGARGGKDDP